MDEQNRQLRLPRDFDEEIESQQLRQAQVHGGDSADNTSNGAPRCPFGNGGGGSQHVKLNVIDRTHHTSEGTSALLEEIGGVASLTRMTELFYERMFADPHLDQFVRDQTDPHAERLADWISEKMGGHPIWTEKRTTRPRKQVILANGYRHVVHDRSSAHAAAWHSPKRAPEVVGQHFKLNDARNWLRLMFWSARDVGLLNNERFADWYQRFLGHFVRVYESKAVQFIRESARWSESQANIEAYRTNGNRMADVHVSYAEALQALLPEERPGATEWPYEQE